MTPWEEQRRANMERNRNVLKNLGLDNMSSFLTPKVMARKPVQKAQSRKRKASEIGVESPSKAPKIYDGESPASTPGSLRRSGRNAGKSVDYVSEKREFKSVSSVKKGLMEMEARDIANQRIHNPKRFGHIPGVPVGSWWETREACSLDAIHAPWVAGISGSSEEGAYSICLSGGYEDDVDLGYGFTFTGSGGRDLKGTKNQPKNLRTAPQSSDQSFENPFNKALKVSSDTGRPVRVVRGYKLQSKFAPYEGYRYDGLYTVEEAWMEPGLNKQKFLVCKFALKRLEGQPPLSVRDDEDD